MKGYRVDFWMAHSLSTCMPVYACNRRSVLTTYVQARDLYDAIEIARKESEEILQDVIKVEVMQAEEQLIEKSIL